MFFDTHCHLNFQAFDTDLDEVIARAREKNVEHIVIPGAKLDSSQKAVEIAQKYSFCHAAVGIHPHHLQEYIEKGPEELTQQLISLSSFEQVVAIGEIGIDYYVYKGYPPVDEESKKKQRELFILQLDIARTQNKPVIIHCRNAHDDLISLLREYMANHPFEGVVHCFDGEIRHLHTFLEMGFYIGYDGNITYPENERQRDLIHETPPDRLLIETDAPYLTPIPHRRTRNEPSYILYTAQTIGDIHKKSLEEIGEITYQNATKLFRL